LYNQGASNGGCVPPQPSIFAPSSIGSGVFFAYFTLKLNTALFDGGGRSYLKGECALYRILSLPRTQTPMQLNAYVSW